MLMPPVPRAARCRHGIYLSEDDGRSWNLRKPVVVRDDLPNKDLGYPTAALRRDGSLYVGYYAQDFDGVTKIHADIVRPEELAA